MFGASRLKIKLPQQLRVKNPSACNAGDTEDVGSIPELGRSPEVGNGNPLQDSCLGNPMDRGAPGAIVHWVTKSQTQLSTYTHIHTHIHTQAKDDPQTLI